MERIHRKRDSGPPAWHSLPVFLLLAAVGGVLEAYTYLLHNGVFCNAQTGNLVLIVFNLVGGEPGRAVQRLKSCCYNRASPAGHPSITTPIPAPWDSPQVVIRNSFPNDDPLIL